MTTKNIVPRADGEGELGTSSKKWSKVQAVTGSFDHIQTTTMTSEIYSEGSTKFGDTSDDTHTFTGSAAVYSDNGMTLQATSSTPSGTLYQHDFLTVTDSDGNTATTFKTTVDNPFGAPSGVLIKTLEVSASAGTDVLFLAGSPDPIYGTGGSLALDATMVNIGGLDDVSVASGYNLALDGQYVTMQGGQNIEISASQATNIFSGQDVIINASLDATASINSGDVDITADKDITLLGQASQLRVGSHVSTNTAYFLVDGQTPAVDDLLFYARPSSYGSGHSRYTSFGYDTTYNCSRFTAGYGGAGGDNQFIWYVSNDTDSEFEAMFLDFSGNLGIGTTTPTKTLDVVGNISASQEISASSFWGDGSNLSGLTLTETDTLATVTARGATTTTPVYFNTHITASNGINSGPLHVMGSSVHSGTIDMYAGGGLYFFGNDGTQSGSLTNIPGGLLLTPDASGKVAVAGNLSASSDISAPNITASVHIGQGATINFENTGSLIWAKNTGQDLHLEGGRDVYIRPDRDVKVYTGTGAGTKWVEFDGTNQKVEVTGDINVSQAVTASSFVGDGSGLTGVTGDWDGQHTGDAAITGSLDISGDLDVGDTGIAPKLYRRAISKSNSQHKANYLASEDYVSWYSAYGVPSLSNPMLTNTFYLANTRWEISSSNSSAYKLFDNDYAGGPLTIAAGDTLPVSVTFTGSNQIYGTSDRGITYPQGYFIATFLGGGNGIENASQFDVTLHYSGGITQTIPDSDKEMIAANSYGQNNCWKLNLTTSTNYLNKVELNLTANGGAVCYFTEFEYFQSKPASQSGWDFSGFTKYEDQTLYRKLSWNNASLAEVGSIDEDGLTTMTRYKANNTSHPGTPSGGAFMYAISGVTGGDMYVKDAGGNQTKISPHDEHGEWEYFSKNTKTGKVVRIRMEKMIRKLEELTGETFIEEE